MLCDGLKYRTTNRRRVFLPKHPDVAGAALVMEIELMRHGIPTAELYQRAGVPGRVWGDIRAGRTDPRLSVWLKLIGAYREILAEQKGAA